MQPRPFRPRELAYLIGVPLLWAGLLLFHPGGGGTEIYLDLRDNVTAWMAIHLGMLIFLPLMGLVMYLLLRDVPGTAARVSRIAVVPFVVFYSAFETLMGIGNGILANAVNGLPLGLAGFLITAHPPPYGPTGLVLFVLAVVVYWRSGSVVKAAAPLGRPTPA